ncbi:hypothetical protein CPAST_c30030 [Clostridium pasteurianum DSM 525 = ATCC 6013]|uniref:Uncharacterized protein n=1 Tax=Clostridium pasteurianum DSM 525 = ATCC 6013 TaxID=1262449 RepID=A0A0H3J6J6_CLOPA|nr:hypothetical protein [Clostridium pasteurianum]AJA49069.1 hypothetical protein CPAST_c30030 [Clostridium pasteurianum DSM 525 = ATCC 6013]AJA53057.1 hypothetical protein CLPA_c30030 [Clostridium pasteurianum DSM 525 = ATCC 6013]AOZ76271.1 hypothetical protein AQ983_14605 [Clostridium pasteurianum DSM 525 = ATCC 6013]AOZ80067.1 hypothetical protein AQ984_14600 [Clostridium pasteurianum]ELP59006.1 hypothetical protein F502_10971 [Clostridium pasteurianum DSM 525 = ATCC 6013]
MKMISNGEDVLTKPIFSISRLGVSNAASYNSVKYDIHTNEYDLVVEVKCSRKSIIERGFQKEFSSDIYPYEIKNVYDKDNIIKDIDSIIKSYAKNGNYFDENLNEIVIQKEQIQNMNYTPSKQVQISKSFNITSNLSKKNCPGDILDIFA